MKHTFLTAAVVSSLSLGSSPRLAAEELFYSAFYDADNKPVRELEENKDYRFEIYVQKVNENRKTWTLGCGILTNSEISFQAIAPNPHYTNGLRPDFFKDFVMDDDNFVDDVGVSRYVGAIRDPIRNKSYIDGPLNGEGVIGMYTATVKTNPPLVVRILGLYNAGERYIGDFDTRYFIKFKNQQYAIVPKSRTHSLLMIEKEKESSAWVYATGIRDKQGKPRSMVMQRSLADITGPWQNVYTNSITAENPYGSINYVDTDAKGKSAFYRVVSPETARQTGKASLKQAWTSNPGR